MACNVVTKNYINCDFIRSIPSPAINMFLVLKKGSWQPET
jgi:hypothetical protein